MHGAPDPSDLALATPGGAEIRYGAFLASVIAFLLVAVATYYVVGKPMERMRKPEGATTKSCPECASEIPLAAWRCPMCTSQLPA